MLGVRTLSWKLLFQCAQVLFSLLQSSHKPVNKLLKRTPHLPITVSWQANTGLKTSSYSGIVSHRKVHIIGGCAVVTSHEQQFLILTNTKVFDVSGNYLFINKLGGGIDYTCCLNLFWQSERRIRRRAQNCARHDVDCIPEQQKATNNARCKAVLPWVPWTSLSDMVEIIEGDLRAGFICML